MHRHAFAHRPPQPAIAVCANPIRIKIPKTTADEFFARPPKEFERLIVYVTEAKFVVVDDEGIADAGKYLLVPPAGGFYFVGSFAPHASQLQMSLYASHQFAGRKRLEQVIIGPRNQ